MCNLSQKICSIRRFVNHMKGHTTQEKPLKCNFCSETFVHVEPFEKHKKVHEAKPHHCKFCQYSSVRKSSVDLHEKIHFDDRPYSYKCNSCQKRFRSKRCIILHTRVHTGEKPFQWKMCPKKFSQSTHRLTHVKLIHTDDKVFACDI